MLLFPPRLLLWTVTERRDYFQNSCHNLRSVVLAGTESLRVLCLILVARSPELRVLPGLPFECGWQRLRPEGFGGSVVGPSAHSGAVLVPQDVLTTC